MINAGLSSSIGLTAVLNVQDMMNLEAVISQNNFKRFAIVLSSSIISIFFFSDMMTSDMGIAFPVVILFSNRLHNFQRPDVHGTVVGTASATDTAA